MSALPPKADMCSALTYVCFGSEADMCSAKRHVRFTPESDRNSGHRGFPLALHALDGLDALVAVGAAVLLGHLALLLGSGRILRRVALPSVM
jgi:hypothetical protein